MSYERVIPRDLFNEANLLKCYGRLSILAETTTGLLVEGFMQLCEPFLVQQDEMTGATYLANVLVTAHGRVLNLRRPLNSRENWPLYVEGIEDDFDVEPVSVFADAGVLSAAFLALVESLAA